jgi:hypothetical protein
MSDNMDSIIKTTTNVSESGVVFAGFNKAALIVAIPATNPKIDTTNRYIKYVKLDDVKVDFADDTVEYKKAEAFFNQEIVPDELYIVAMDDAEDINDVLDDFVRRGGGAYFIGTTLTDQTKLEDMADKIETRSSRCRFIIVSHDADTLDNTKDTDIASYIKSKGYEKTNVVHHNDTDEHLDMKLIGRIYSIAEGESWENRVMKSISIDNLSSTHKETLKDKRCGYVVNIQDEAVTKNIVAGNGWYADIKRGVDYIDHAIDLKIVDLMVDNNISKTNAQLAKIKTAVVEVMEEGIEREIVDADTLIYNVPLANELNAGRDITLENLYEYDYLHSMHSIRISGTVTI